MSCSVAWREADVFRFTVICSGFIGVLAKELSSGIRNRILLIYEPSSNDFLEGQRCVVYELARGSWGPKQVCDAL